MRLSSSANAWVLTVAVVTSGSIITPTTGFQQRASSSSSSSSWSSSPSPRSCVGSSSIRVSATADAATATPPPSSSVVDAAASAAMTYADVNGLAFRALQRECKALGLSAIGTTAALRGRLLGHFGLERGEVDVVAPVMTAAEIEVSFELVLPFLSSLYLGIPHSDG